MDNWLRDGHTVEAPETAKAAQAWLDELRGYLPKLPRDIANIEGESPVLIWLAERYTGDDYQRWRRRTAEEIMKLERAVR